MAYANRGEVDEQMAYELDGYIQSDGDLYRQRYLPIVKNLVNKMAQEKYDRGMAIKAFMYLVDDGAKKYHREFHYDVPWNVMANKPTREEVAKSIRDSFEVEAKLGNWDQLLTKVSAAKRAKSSANRSGSTQTAYNVYLNGKLIDTVFYSGKTDVDDVRRGLINHDGYDSRISVRKRPKPRTANRSMGARGTYPAPREKSKRKVCANCGHHVSMHSHVGTGGRGPGRCTHDGGAGCTCPAYRQPMKGERIQRNRSGTAKPRPLGTDRDRFNSNPNARKSRNKSGPRKTKDEYQLQVNYGYGHGWEHEISEDTLAAARERRKEYRANTNYPVRIQKKRVKL